MTNTFEILPKESNHICLSKGYLLNILQGLTQIVLLSVLQFLVIEVGAQRASPGIKSLALFAWSQPQFSSTTRSDACAQSQE